MGNLLFDLVNKKLIFKFPFICNFLKIKEDIPPPGAGSKNVSNNFLYVNFRITFVIFWGPASKIFWIGALQQYTNLA